MLRSSLLDRDDEPLQYLALVNLRYLTGTLPAHRLVVNTHLLCTLNRRFSFQITSALLYRRAFLCMKSR